MLEPLFAFSFVIATMLGAACHLIFGGGARRLAIFLIGSWAGFALGQVAGESFDLSIVMIGELHLFTAIIGSTFFLMMVLIFTTERRTTR